MNHEVLYQMVFFLKHLFVQLESTNILACRQAGTLGWEEIGGFIIGLTFSLVSRTQQMEVDYEKDGTIFTVRSCCFNGF